MKTWFEKAIEERAERNSKAPETSKPDEVTPEPATEKESKKVQTKKKK